MDSQPGRTRHRLPVEFLQMLAVGGGSADAVRFLWQTELSRRLLLVFTLFDHCASAGGLAPLPAAADAWAVLSQAHARNRRAVDDLLMHPQVGSAAAYVLRRQRGGTTSDLPSWIDLGTVHVLALIAAARAGLPWSTRLPLRHGTVMLPTLGMALFPTADPASTVEARTEAGVITLSGHGREVEVAEDPAEDTEAWWSLRHVLVGDSNMPLTVWLDDVDPFRELADPEPPARLDPAAFARWRRLLADAWSLLREHHAESAPALAEGVVSVVPLQAVQGWDTRSASNGEAFGAVMVSEPSSAVSLAVALVHEFQHIKLGALMHLLKLVGDDDGTLYYAPWRDDPRPLGGFLQGIYAFFGIAEFWRQRRPVVTGTDAALASYEYLYSRSQTAEALRSVRNAARLTDIGRGLVHRLDSVVESWGADEVEPEITRLARLTADSHRTAWRLRHQRPAEAEAAVLAKAWLANRGPVVPSPPVLRPVGPLRWSQRIPALARQRVLAATPHKGGDDPLAAADRALVNGEVATAANAYLARISRPADGSDDEILAWVGLALALSDSLAHSAGATAMRCRPDLVRAVHDEVAAAGGSPDAMRIAAWLAPVVTDV